jgi:hypothetical protein
MLEVVKFISKLANLGVLSLVLVGFNGIVTQAQRSNSEPIDLLLLNCPSTGDGSLNSTIEGDITIGRQNFTPKFYIDYLTETPFLYTCKLTPSEQSKTLQLEFGIEDYALSAAHQATVSVYLDGQLTASQAVSAGEGKTMLLDVTNNTNIALEMTCTSTSSCPTLYFLQADILPSSSPSPPPTSSLTNPSSQAVDNSDSNVVNSSDQKADPALKGSSWGNSTVGEEPATSGSNSSSGGSDINNTIDDVNTIIDIFK